MIPVFIGYDDRQPIAFAALTQSLISHASVPIAITPLVIHTLPVKRVGLTPFTYSRFLVPHLMNYRGWAIFLDIDIMLRADINELWKLRDDRYAAMVVPHDGKLKFEQASVMLLNCEKCKILTPDYVLSAGNLHTMGWLTPEQDIGRLPHEWNHLVGYYDKNPDAKLAHFTQGNPIYDEVRDSEFAEEWMGMAQKAVSTVPWTTLMGNSVHAAPVMERLSSRKLANQGAK